MEWDIFNSARFIEKIIMLDVHAYCQQNYTSHCEKL